MSDDSDALIADLLPRYFENNLRIRKELTKKHYHRSVRQFSAAIGHDARLGDLTDENVHRFMRSTLDERQCEATANQRMKQLRAFWGWAARKRLTNEFPGRYKIPEPERQPKAYTKDELQRLFAACAEMTGWIGPHRASTWWLTLHWIVLDTAERVGAVLAIRREWIDVQQGTLGIPGKHRKGGVKAATYRLSERTMELIAEMLRAPSEAGLLFDRTFKHDASLYKRYRVVMEKAGIPWTRRKSGLHKMRVTVATMLEANGHDATKFLMHSTRRTTEESYIDAAQVLKQRKPVTVQFNPESKPGLLSRLFRRPR